MFIEELKHQFYNKLIGKRSLIIVNYDIDAICASKILQTLFKYDNMLYSVVPVMGTVGLRRAYNEHKDDIKYVLLLNCGGCVDIVELLQPEKDVTFFICDTHRPLDVCNIYSDRQVCILCDPALEENIPAFDSLFCEIEDDAGQVAELDADSINGSENDVDAANVEHLSRRQILEQRILKNRDRRRWESDRDRIMFEYTQYSYYGRSTALIIFELAWLLSKDNIDMLWCAIVGVTEQLVLGKIESSVYTLEIESIQSHVSRFLQKDTEPCAANTNKIVFEKDLHLVLYRHWSIIESMRYSWYCASKLKLWTLRGDKKLHELLVEMGLPLAQARQNFGAMDLMLRQEFFSMVEKLAEKYSIPNIIYGSFSLNFGYRNRYAAADYVYALLAILESANKDKTPEECFLNALDALSRSNNHVLSTGIHNAKILLSTIYKQVQNSLEAQQVCSSGTFFYYVMPEGDKFFSYPYGLTLLARFLLHGHVAMSRKRQAHELPFVASCPIDKELGLNLLLGLPPVREDSPKNFFGKAFVQAAIKSNATILQDFFDSSIIQIRQSDLTRFLDALTVLLS